MTRISWLGDETEKAENPLPVEDRLARLTEANESNRAMAGDILRMSEELKKREAEAAKAALTDLLCVCAGAVCLGAGLLVLGVMWPAALLLTIATVLFLSVAT